MDSFIIRKRGKHKGVLFFRNIPEDVKNIFKGTCSRRGDAMQAVILALMKKYIKNPRIIERKPKITKPKMSPSNGHEGSPY
jgi:hypothetical protein